MKILTKKCTSIKNQSINIDLDYLDVQVISKQVSFEPTLAGVWDSSVLTELEEEQWDPVFVSDPDTRRFLDSGELDI